MTAVNKRDSPRGTSWSVDDSALLGSGVEKPLEGAGPVARILAKAADSRMLALAIIALAAAGYPIAALSHGLPRFHSTNDCVLPAKDGENAYMAFGRFNSYPPANARLAKIKQYGFVTAAIVPDQCGQLVVSILYPNAASAEGALSEAHSVHLYPTIASLAASQ